MKRMRISMFRAANAVLAAILATLGISSCESTQEYGCPFVNYQVKGTVTDSENRPVEGIKMKVEIIEEYEDKTFVLPVDSTMTDSEGHYQTNKTSAYDIDENMKLIVEDVDGEANGLFENDTIALSGLPQKRTKKGDGNWYQGEYELTGNVTLREKKGE